MGLLFRDDKPLPLPVTASAGGARPARAVAYGAVRSLTASAKSLGKNELDVIGAKVQPYRAWQKDAWVGYDRIGEVHYGFNLVANIFSRVRVFGAVITSSDEAPVTLAQAREDSTISSELARRVEVVMADLIAADFTSQARTFAINMSVAGECLLLELPPSSEGTMVDTGEPGKWVIRSTNEIVVEADRIRMVPRSDLASTADRKYILAERRGGQWTPALNIGRIWRRHPSYGEEPDSSMRSISDSVEELLLTSRLTRNATRARLNAGMVFVPDGITVVNSASALEEQAVDLDGNPVVEAAVDDSGAFLSDLMDAMITPIDDETAASSVVPMVVTGPGEMGSQIKHLTFERKSDAWLTERADRALERILQGIDVPKEVVTGLADVKYTNAVQIDENLYKANIEPLALVFADALTDIYLRPTLLSQGVSEADAARVCVWYDPSAIVTRPDQSSDATDGFDRFLLSGEAWRRVHGFTESDAPDEKELAVQLLLAKAQLPEDVTQSLLQFALPKVMNEQREDNLANRDVKFPESAAQMLNGPVDNAGEQQENEAVTQPRNEEEEGQQ